MILLSIVTVGVQMISGRETGLVDIDAGSWVECKKSCFKIKSSIGSSR